MAISLTNPFGTKYGPSMTTPTGEDNFPYNPNVNLPGGTTGGINPNNMYTGGNDPGHLLVTQPTGGVLPPAMVTSAILPPAQINTGGVLPPMQVVPTVNTGGNLPPQTAVHMGTGGNLPPQVLPTPGTPGVPNPGNPAAFDINSILQNLWASTGGAGPQANPASLANQYMADLLSKDNPYLRDARTRAMATAAGRGLSNSSIAAGNAESAAINAAQPLFQAAYGLNAQRENNTFQGAQNRFNQGMNLLGQREQNAFTAQQHQGDLTWQGQQAQADRDLKSKLQSDATFQQDYLANQDFTRQFNAALSMIPINTANQFMQSISQYAIENPEIYTPETISGMQNFFTQTMSSMLKQFFPDLGE